MFTMQKELRKQTLSMYHAERFEYVEIICLRANLHSPVCMGGERSPTIYQKTKTKKYVGIKKNKNINDICHKC